MTAPAFDAAFDADFDSPAVSEGSSGGTAGGISADDVVLWLGLKPAQVDLTLERVVDAVNAYVSGLPVVVNSPPAPDQTGWPADVTLGATMIAARMYRRRNSPAGVEAITESGAQYIARSDIDVARLLRIDTMTAPGIG